MDSKTNHSINPWVTFLTLAAVLIACFHLFALAMRAQNYAFGQDDLQHTHIAWNVFRGKVLFKDFDEHHGPLSAWLNSLLLHLKPGTVESLETLTYLRLFQVVMAGLTSLLIALTVGTLSKSPLKIAIGALAGALFLSLRTVQSFGFQTRPDIYVGFFTVAFLGFFIREKRFWAGVCLGFALGFHPKFLPINVGLILADQLALGLKQPLKKRLSVLKGEGVVLGIIGVVLALQGALVPAMNRMFLGNISLVSKRVVQKTEILADLFFKLWKLDPVILLLLVLAIGILIRMSRSSLRVFFIATALACGLFLLSPIHEYALLVILPLVVIVVVHIVMELPWGKMETMALGFLLALGAVNSLLAIPMETAIETKIRRSQGEILSTTLYKLKRTEPMFYVWFSRCPAYVFNEDSKMHWPRSPRSMDEADSVLPGFPVSRDRARESRSFEWNRLAEENIRYVAIDDMFVGQMSDVERNYLKSQFTKDICLWTRG